MEVGFTPRRVSRKRRRKRQISTAGWVGRYLAVVLSTTLIAGAILWFTGYGEVKTGVETETYMLLTPAVVLGGTLMAYGLARIAAEKNQGVQLGMVFSAFVLIALTTAALWNRSYTQFVIDRYLVSRCERAVAAGEVIEATRGCGLKLARGYRGSLYLQARQGRWPFWRRLSMTELEAAISAELGAEVRFQDPQPTDSLIEDPPEADALRLYLTTADETITELIEVDVRPPEGRGPWRLELWWFPADQLTLAGHHEMSIP